MKDWGFSEPVNHNCDTGHDCQIHEYEQEGDGTLDYLNFRKVHLDQIHVFLLCLVPYYLQDPKYTYVLLHQHARLAHLLTHWYIQQFYKILNWFDLSFKLNLT